MMLSKKNSETLENFSEKLEVDVLCITVRRLPV